METPIIKNDFITVNYKKSGIMKPKYIVIHYFGSVGTAAGIVSWFKNPKAQSSAHYVLDENSLHGLKELVRKYLPEYGNYEKQDAFDKIPWDKKPLKPLCTYGCQDTDYTFRLMIFFEKKLIDKGLYSLYRNMIMTASRVLTQVEKNGLYFREECN